MKKLITLMIAFAMTLSLAACGSADKFVEPAIEDLKYGDPYPVYGGRSILEYNGDAKALRIPSELDGEPVKTVILQFNTNITRLKLPDSVTYINFSGCSNLTEVIIPNGITRIDSGAFINCSSLTKITIPDSVTIIGEYVFQNCSSLKEITIPDGVEAICEDTFNGCSSLTKVTIPDSVTAIGGAFQNCSSLKEITIPDSVIKIVGNTFEGCTSLTSIKVPEGLDLSNAGLGDNVEIIYY